MSGHLGARGAQVWRLEPLSESNLDALPVSAWPSGRQTFLPRTRVSGIHSAPLDRDDLRAGVGPRAWRRDGPQLLENSEGGGGHVQKVNKCEPSSGGSEGWL